MVLDRPMTIQHPLRARATGGTDAAGFKCLAITLNQTSPAVPPNEAAAAERRTSFIPTGLNSPARQNARPPAKYGMSVNFIARLRECDYQIRRQWSRDPFRQFTPARPPVPRCIASARHERMFV